MVELLGVFIQYNRLFAPTSKYQLIASKPNRKKAKTTSSVTLRRAHQKNGGVWHKMLKL